MKKSFILTMLAMMATFASFAQDPIIGSPGACAGSTGHVIDSTLGGTWSISPTSVATIDASGTVYAVSPGVATITYTAGSSYVTSTFTVGAVPGPITGTLSACPGTVTTLSNATPGGTWSSTYTVSATVDAASGAVYAVMPSSATQIRYTTAPGCYVTAVFNVNDNAVAPITGGTTVCVGDTLMLTDTTGGGVWSSSNTSVATVTYVSIFNYGMVTAVAAGTTTISYTVSGACGTYTATHTVTVTTGTPPAAITGPSSVTAGSTIALADATPGGVWSVTPGTVANIGAGTGVLTGVAAGTATVTYAMTGCSSAYATHTVTVNPFDGIMGTIHFPATPFYGPVKVWLITYVSPMLTAVDSTIVYSSGYSATYQFAGEPTDSYRIKAAVIDTITSLGDTTYVPTYHYSSHYWSTASVLPHTSGTTDAGVDINMMFGIATAGPGFIGGDVTTGANKGTSTSVPVSNLIMYLFNASTSTLVQAVRTDAAGHYSFSNLPAGTYFVFPDSLNYATTPYNAITLTSGSPSFSAASFIQHTLAKTITPIGVSVNDVNATASVVAFPNPTTGKVNIAWQLPSAQNASVLVTDVTGRIVYSSNIQMAAGAGSSMINLGSLTSGLYTVSVKSDALNYNTKIQVQH